MTKMIKKIKVVIQTEIMAINHVEETMVKYVINFLEFSHFFLIINLNF